jgi:hypothetical protein
LEGAWCWHVFRLNQAFIYGRQLFNRQSQNCCFLVDRLLYLVDTQKLLFACSHFLSFSRGFEKEIKKKKWFLSRFWQNFLVGFDKINFFRISSKKVWPRKHPTQPSFSIVLNKYWEYDCHVLVVLEFHLGELKKFIWVHQWTTILNTVIVSLLLSQRLIWFNSLFRTNSVTSTRTLNK